MSLELKIKRISAKRSQQVVSIVERLAQELNLDVLVTKISTTNSIAEIKSTITSAYRKTDVNNTKFFEDTKKVNEVRLY